MIIKCAKCGFDKFIKDDKYGGYPWRGFNVHEDKYFRCQTQEDIDKYTGYLCEKCVEILHDITHKVIRDFILAGQKPHNE